MSNNVQDVEDLVHQINEALLRSGERDKLKQLVRDKLKELGWFEKVKEEAEKEMKSKNIETLSPQELSSTIYPKAMELVPGKVRAELQEEIRRFLDAHVKIA